VHPTRQYLGNLLIKAKKYREAVTVFQQDLVVNPNNGWSLTGLARALSALHQTAAAKEAAAKAKKAFAHSDVKIGAAVY
jgi:tetratricopeptide (TPR) repeat protein